MLDRSTGKNIWILLVGLLFAGMTLAGLCYDLAGNSMTIVAFLKEKTNTFLVMFVFLFVAYYGCCCFLFQRIDRKVGSAPAGEALSAGSAPVDGTASAAGSALVDGAAPAAGSRFRVPRLRWILTWGIIFLCWLPYLILCFPGTTAGMDYFWQLTQGCGALPLSNHHPVLGSLVFGLLYRIGYALAGVVGGLVGVPGGMGGVSAGTVGEVAGAGSWAAAGGIAFTCLFQMLLMSAVLGYCLAALRRLGIPSSVYCVLTGIFCLCPVFPTHAMWAVKDSIFSSIAILFFFGVYLYALGIRDSMKVPWFATLPGLVGIGILFSLYRNGTYPVAILLFLVVIYLSIRKKQPDRKPSVDAQNRQEALAGTKRPDRKAWLRACAALIVFVAIVTGCNRCLDIIHVYPTNFREAAGTLGRQLLRSYHEHPGKFSEEQIRALKYAYRDNLERGVSLEELAKERNYRIVPDGAKPAFFEDQEEVKAYLDIWLKMGLQNPEIYLDEVLHGSYSYWWWGVDSSWVLHPAPVMAIHEHFDEYDYGTKPIKAFFYPIGQSLQGNEQILNQTMPEHLEKYPYLRELIYLQNSFPKARDRLGSVLSTLEDIPIVSLLFRPGLYTWLLLFGLAYLFSRRVTGRCLWPVLLMVAMACASPANGYMRYMLSVDLLSLLMVGMCFVPREETVELPGRTACCSRRRQRAGAAL